jgi:hypothetical protein
VFVATGTCLEIRYLENTIAYSPVSQSLHINGCTNYNILQKKSMEQTLHFLRRSLATESVKGVDETGASVNSQLND